MDKYNINHDPKCNLQRGSSSCAIFFLSRRSELNKRSLARQETSSFVPQRVLHQTISSNHLLQPLQQIGLYMKVLTMTSKATHHNWSLIDWTKSKNCHILPPPSLPHVIQLKTKKLQDLWNCSRSKILNNPRLKYLSLSASLNRIALKFTNIWRTKGQIFVQLFCRTWENGIFWWEDIANKKLFLKEKLISAYKYYLSKKIERKVEWKDIDNPSGLVPTLSNGQDNPRPSVSSLAKTKINNWTNILPK